MAPSDRPAVLVLSPLPVVGDDLECEIVFHHWWKLSDLDRFLDEHGAHIRGLAASGKSVVGPSLMDRLPNLEIIANFGVGYDLLDTRHAASRNVVVTNTPDVLTEEVADLAMGLLLATLRRIPQAARFLSEGSWLQGAFPLSPSLRGRHVGIVGLGRIGKAIARRVAASNVEVSYTGRRPQDGVPYRYYPSVLALAEAVDTLILAAPGGKDTFHLIERSVLHALGPYGVLINVGRGSLVDEAALVAALQLGEILGAGLDVFEDEPNVPGALLEAENVVLLPHIGSATRETRRAMGQLVLDNLRSWFKGNGALTPIPSTPQG